MPTTTLMPVLMLALPPARRVEGRCGFAGDDDAVCTAEAVDRLSLHREDAEGRVVEVLLDDVPVCDTHFHIVAAQLASTYVLD